MGHKHIQLRCPKCKRQLSVKRREEDYPDAVRLEVTCPDCNAGDFCEPMYFDKSGNHIIRDPGVTPPL